MKRSDFKKEADLKSMNVGDIKKHVRTFNDDYAIKGYSKLKKAELISAILSAQTRIGTKKTKKKVKLVIVEEPKKKASPVAKKASPVAKKASPVAKTSGDKLTSNRQVVQALLDGAIHLLDFGHINEGLEKTWAGTQTIGGLTMGERKELLKRFQDSPALSKKLLAYDFHKVQRAQGRVGKKIFPINMYKVINENLKLREEKLRTDLGRDTATGKLKTLETSTRPKAVRDLKEYLALPLWKKIEEGLEVSFMDEIPNWTLGDDVKVGKLLYDAMIEISAVAKKATPAPAPVKKVSYLSPREVFMRGDFTEAYKKERSRIESKLDALPSLAAHLYPTERDEKRVAEEKPKLEKELIEKMAFTNTPLFEVGESVRVKEYPGASYRQDAEIVALGKTISIRFDENDYNVTDKKERGGTKRFIKYDRVVSEDRMIVMYSRDVMLPYGGSEIV